MSLLLILLWAPVVETLVRTLRHLAAKPMPTPPVEGTHPA